MQLPVRIISTASLLPGEPRTTEELAAIAMPGRDPADVVRRTGIRTRWFADEGTTMASMGATVMASALAKAGMAPGDLRRLIFVNSTGGDVHMPATANALLDHLGVAHSCACFDLNNACVGFMSALDAAARCVATGVGPVGVVVAELGSRHIRPDDPRPYVIFGDVAIAAVIGPAEADEAFLGTAFGNNGALRDTVVMAHAGRTLQPGGQETIKFSKSYADIKSIAIDGLTRSAEQIFAATGASWQSVDWVVPHQPNGAMLTMIQDHFAIPAARIVPVVGDIGSVGAASVAYGLDRLLCERDVKAGQTVLMLGVGAGLSYGAILYRCGPDAERRQP